MQNESHVSGCIRKETCNSNTICLCRVEISMKRIVLTALVAVSATGAPAQATTKTTMANPAATFCIENDGEYQIRKNTDGSEYGVCILPDGTEVDAWDYLRSHFEN